MRAPGRGPCRDLEVLVEQRTAQLREANRALEREIRERLAIEERLEAKNQELESLLHVTSHDLKEPLRAIESFSRLVAERCADRLDAKGRDFLQRVVRAAARLKRLLDDLTVLSRARTIEVPKEDVDAATIVDDALTRLSGWIEQSNARVTVDPDLPRLRADPTWATQAVYNLVGNALKYVGGDARPDIRIGAFAPGEGEADEAGLVVADRGSGVAPEHAERIFALFQRAVGRDVEGTGAGLAIVGQVAARHGGRAWVRPRKGGGSEFVLTFRSPSRE